MKSVFVSPGKPGIPVDIEMTDIRSALGWISFAYPFDDPVCLVHDDNGIANGRSPNRTVNGQIVPGPFYILGIDASNELTDLSPDLQAKYLKVFSVPESFPSGKWKVITRTKETKHTAIIILESAWIPDDDAIS